GWRGAWWRADARGRARPARDRAPRRRPSPAETPPEAEHAVRAFRGLSCRGGVRRCDGGRSLRMPLARSLVSLAAAAALAAGAAGSTPPVGYQGRLESDGRPVSGDVRLRFPLFHAPQGGRRVGDGVDLPA